jgi:hypothetical protein
VERFLCRHQSRIIGSISGFDRMRFQGTFTNICHVEGMGKFLNSQGVLLKNFGTYMQALSERIKDHAKRLAEKTGRPLQYVASSQSSKEDIAMEIAKRDGIREGLICILSCVEPCYAFGIVKDRLEKRLRLVKHERKCLHLYFYYLDSDYGLMHIRLQTWAPFMVQICVNGREWLARQLDRKQICYKKHDNCFSEIGDLEQAQRLLDQLHQQQWAKSWNQRMAAVHPFLGSRTKPHFQSYYWTLHQAEYATDILFKDASALSSIYSALLRHAIEEFRSRDVLRFLGRRIQDARFSREIRTHMGVRVEGVRIKHWVEENSIKMYDKAGSVLRIETTINNPKRFRVRRMVCRRGRKQMAWTYMRKGVVDIRRRVQLCHAANGRYLDALAVVGETTPSHRILDRVSAPVLCRDRRFRPLRPISPDDSAFFQEILRPEHLIQGVRNRQLRHAIYPDAEAEPQSRRLASGRVTRRLQLFRIHGLLFRVPKTSYYRLTKKGHDVMNTAVRFRNTNVALFAL